MSQNLKFKKLLARLAELIFLSSTKRLRVSIELLLLITKIIINCHRQDLRKCIAADWFLKIFQFKNTEPP